MPCSPASSWRAPDATQTPSETVLECGISWVTTLQAVGETWTSVVRHAMPLRRAARRCDTKAATAVMVVRHTIDPLRQLALRRDNFGRRRARRPMALAIASGNLAGCAVASVIIGTSGSRTTARAAAVPDGRMRIGAGSRSRSSMRWISAASRPRSRGAASKNSRSRASSPALKRDTAPSAPRPPSARPPAPNSRLGELEQQPLEIRRDLDVHARANVVGTTPRGS